MHKKVLIYFKKHDPILFAAYKTLQNKQILIQKRNPNEYFVSLCREIVGQQLSGKAASAIFGKFQALFPKSRPTPNHILKLSDKTLRSSGISWAKVSYVKDLAKKVHNNTLKLKTFHGLSQDSIIEQLTTVKGIGLWTAEMFLIFAIGKEDVFSYKDLGLRKGLQKIYSLNALPTDKECISITQKWSPYRSFGSLILWKYLEI